MLILYENWTGITIASQLVVLIALLDIATAIVAIIMERHQPSAALAWILVIFMLPGVGMIFYWLLSQNAARRKMFRLSSFEEETIDESLEKQIKEMDEGDFEFSTSEGKKWQDMIHLNQLYGRAYYTQNNSVSAMTDGYDMYRRLLEDIKGAERTINIMFFIIKNDFTGKELIEALTRKAREGVEVRLLMDSMGSRTINDKVLAEFISAGGKRSYFFPRKLRINIRFNYRNHRKIAVIDGEIGYIGGFNIGREYLGKKKKFGYWRDTHIRLTGQCVQDLNARFILDWRFSSKEDIILSEAYYSPVIDGGNTGIQIISSGPDTIKEEIKRSFMKMITSAKRSIYIQTPYFVPDKSIIESLKMAAQSGVDVRLMIPDRPDHPFVYWATYAYAGELIKSGGRVYKYTKGFLHAKTMAVDGEVGTVGSTNFDRRSFSLNFESNAIIYDRNEVNKMEMVFKDDMNDCLEITRAVYDKRSVWIKIKEVVSRLLSDLL